MFLQLWSRKGGSKASRPGRTPAARGPRKSVRARSGDFAPPRSVRLKPNSCQDRPRLLHAGRAESVRPKPGNVTANSFAQINRCRYQALVRGRRVKVELIARRAASKAPVDVLLEVS